jgi:hypothetical protein
MLAGYKKGWASRRKEVSASRMVVFLENLPPSAFRPNPLPELQNASPGATASLGKGRRIWMDTRSRSRARRGPRTRVSGVEP